MNGSEAKEGKIRARDWLPVIPGILFVLTFIFQLFLDLFMNPDASTQATLFASMIRAVNFFSLAFAIFFMGYGKDQKEKQKFSFSLFLRNNSHFFFFTVFYVFVLLSSVINGITRDVLFGMEYRNIGILELFIFLFIYVKLPDSVKDTKVKRIVAGLFLLASSLIALCALYDRFIGKIAAFAGKKGLSAIFLNGNHYGYFLVMAVCIAFMMTVTEEKMTSAFFCFLAYILNLSVLVINNSAGCFLAVFLTLVLMTGLLAAGKMTNRRFWFMIILLPLVPALMYALMTQGIFAAQIERIFNSVYRNMIETVCDAGNIFNRSILADAAGSNRIRLWKETLRLIMQKPFLGFGCEGISLKLADSFGIYNAHNELLTFAAYFGVPAAAAYVLGVFSIFIKSAAAHDKNQRVELCFLAGSIGYFISSFFGTAMFYTYPLFMIFLGFAHIRKGS